MIPILVSIHTLNFRHCHLISQVSHTALADSSNTYFFLLLFLDRINPNICRLWWLGDGEKILWWRSKALRIFRSSGSCWSELTTSMHCGVSSVNQDAPSAMRVTCWTINPGIPIVTYCEFWNSSCNSPEIWSPTSVKIGLLRDYAVIFREIKARIQHM